MEATGAPRLWITSRFEQIGADERAEVAADVGERRGVRA
jgi:hypothetical protein